MPRLFHLLLCLASLVASPPHARITRIRIPLWLETNGDSRDELTPKDFSATLDGEPARVVDVKRPGEEVIEAMRKQKIYIGRVWPSWPTYVRVSIGTQDEMNKFKTAFMTVMG